MAAVKFAVSFLESLVNDLLSDAADPYMSVNGRMTVFAPVVIAELATVWNESEVRKTKRIQLLDKYQRSLRIAGAAQFVKADRIYSEVGDVIYLRNELVHFKVGWQQVGAKQNQAGDIERRLTPRFPHNRQKIGMPWFPNKCLASGCARWACDSATAFADEWLDRMSLPHDYKQVVRDLGTP
ncbi:Uncharacterised protein [Nocardia brasiliensis]|nr:Uncharacterised protein [Nocardia brasiliensis]